MATSRRHLLLAAGTAALPVALLAQPARTLTLVVPFAPGGTTDIGARLVAARLGAHLGGQPVVVENRAGAGGATAADHVRRQPADGTTLLIGTASTHAVNPALFADLPYDPVRDFAPVALLGVTGFVLVVPATLGITDMAGLVARLKAEPGRHNYASAGVGSMPHLAGEWFAKGAGLRVEHVAYRGGGPALQALLTGEVTYMVESAPTVAGAIADGRLRALARASLRRSGPQAAMPAIADLGIPGFDAETWILAFAPAGTPAATVARLNAGFNAALAEPELVRRLAEVGTVAVPDSTPETTARFVANELARWRRVVAETGVRITRQ
jgi:tripartite-type tricarboxylate transporter receptor subunit TctC